MIQSTMRQQLLAGILVSGCFLAGAVCEQFLYRQPTTKANSTSMVSAETSTEPSSEAVQLTKR